MLSGDALMSSVMLSALMRYTVHLDQVLFSCNSLYCHATNYFRHQGGCGNPDGDADDYGGHGKRWRRSYGSPVPMAHRQGVGRAEGTLFRSG